MSRRAGMTLVELVLGVTLSTVIVGTAAFVFIQSQKIMSTVNTRLGAARSFRVAAAVLDQDGSAIENAAAWNAARTALELKTLAGCPTSGAWFSIVAAPAPERAAQDQRQDVVRFVTHSPIAAASPSGSPLAPVDHVVLVTYKVVAGRGLVRMLDPVDVTTSSTGHVTAAVNDAALPNQAVPGPSITDLAPGATGFAARYYMDGRWHQPDSSSASGAAFQRGMPAALELTISIPDSTTMADSTRLSIVRAVELVAPPP